MSYPTDEKDPGQAFDWHHESLFNNAPYSHPTMIEKLADGEFIIEGKRSNFDDAEMYAYHHSGSEVVWDALRQKEQGIALDGQIF